MKKAGQQFSSSKIASRSYEYHDLRVLWPHAWRYFSHALYPLRESAAGPGLEMQSQRGRQLCNQHAYQSVAPPRNHEQLSARQASQRAIHDLFGAEPKRGGCKALPVHTEDVVEF